MTVYIDDARVPLNVGGRQERCSRLFADTTAELADFTTRLGVPPEGGHHAGASPARWRYLTERQRNRAILFGAIPVPWHATTRLLDRRAG